MDRIPAAIENEKRLLSDKPERIFLVESNGPNSRYVTLTAIEGALAEALWKHCEIHFPARADCCDALIAYTEKIEEALLQ